MLVHSSQSRQRRHDGGGLSAFLSRTVFLRVSFVLRGRRLSSIRRFGGHSAFRAPPSCIRCAPGNGSLTLTVSYADPSDTRKMPSSVVKPKTVPPCVVR